MNFKLSGSIPALITPFRNGRLDIPALKKVIRRAVDGGSSGLVSCGSTGEAATLSDQEYQRVIRETVREARGKVPVIAGIGTNSTAKAVRLAREARGLGADALLVLTPYYNKPTQDGLFLHFKAVAHVVRIPIVAYNVPGRTGVNLLPATLARIARACGNVVAVKEASGSLDQASEILRLVPEGFTVLSGDDSLTLPMMALGAKGVISVLANICPRETALLCDAHLRGDAAHARKMHLRLFPLMRALFLETNPIPVKAAAAKLGLCKNELRLPLTPMPPENAKRLFAELEKLRTSGGRS